MESSQETIPDSQSQGTSDYRLALMGEITSWLNSQSSDDFNERQTILDEVNEYILQVVDSLHPINSSNVEKHFFLIDLFNKLVSKRKCLLGLQTLDSKNCSDLDLLIDSGYADITVSVNAQTSCNSESGFDFSDNLNSIEKQKAGLAMRSPNKSSLVREYIPARVALEEKKSLNREKRSAVPEDDIFSPVKKLKRTHSVTSCV